MVDVNDDALDRVGFFNGVELLDLEKVVQRRPQIGDNFFTLRGEVCRDRREDIPSVEGFADGVREIFLVLKVNDGFLRCAVQKTEKAVVRADKVISLGLYEHGPSLGSHAGIDDADKERSFWEIGIAYG